ncbi:MAG: PAS domain S-box protein, partial [Desulfobulbaceae bacterium]|nr:PAS domain S-box protein [Desulfobulbaceae bacterium]
QERRDDKTREQIAKSLATLNTFKTMHLLFHEREEIQRQIDSLIEEFSRSVARYLLVLRKEESTGEEVREARRKIFDLLDLFVSSVNPHIEKEFSASFQKLAAAKEKTIQARKLLIAASAAILLFALVLSLVISHLLSKPLRALRDAAREIGGGRLDLTLPVTSQDEISDLARAFNDMAGNLSVMRTHLISARDYIDNILASMADALVVVSPAGTMQTVNSATCSLLGCQESDLIGQPLQTIIKEELFRDSDLMELAGKNAIRELNVFLRPRSGEPIPVSISGSAMYDQTGKPQAVILVARDIRKLTQLMTELNKTNHQLKEEIAERIQAELARKESERNYLEIFNATTEAILLHDAEDGAILDVNLAMAEMYGYSRREALACTLGDLSSNAPPYLGQEAVAMIRKAATEGPQVFDWQARHKNGERFWVEISMKGSEIGGHGRVLSVVRDITERKLAEDALATEKERLAVTLRSIGDGVITTDVQGKVLMVNKVAEALTGWHQEEAEGRPFTEIFKIINEKSRTPCPNPVEKVMATGHTVGLANHTILIARDGTERSIADSGAPIRDRESRTIGVVLVFRDVTEEEKREEELLKVKKLESIGVLAGGIAHDFNNILAAILGNISLAMQFVTEEKTHQLLEQAEKASLRARDLTQQLLTFSKGGEPIKKLAAITEIIRESSQFVLRGSNVRCDYHFAEDLWPVEIDSGQISQVIQNIVINADHAMPEGGVIEVRCENATPEMTKRLPPNRSGPFIKITIRDEGIGIARSHIDRIFDPYFSTKSKGSGLGLAITHSIIKKHHGHIWVESEPGAGTTFSILLPAAEGQTVSARRQGDAIPQGGGGQRILVMDDEEMVRQISRQMLSHLGYEVVLARDGAEAIGLYEESMSSGQKIDAIIMDLTIPGGMGGKEAVNRVLTLDRQARVIASSGYSNDPVMANPGEHGFVGAINKPYQLKELLEILTAVLAKQ